MEFPIAPHLENKSMLIMKLKMNIVGGWWAGEIKIVTSIPSNPTNITRYDTIQCDMIHYNTTRC